MNNSLVFRLICSLLLLFPVQGLAGNTITWLEADAPPFFIQQGEKQGTGYQDIIGDIIEQHLPEYQHQRVVANVARHNEEFKAGHEVCTTGYYKTPKREEFLYFSLPTYFTLPTVLVIMKDRLADFGGQKNISLERLMQSNKFVLGLAKDRSYGAEVDEVLKRHGNVQNSFEIASLSLSRNLFEMLQKKRIDALIGLPEEAIYNAELLGVRDQIMTLTIDENQRNYNSWFSYAACSKTEWGKQVIERLNQVLLEQRPTASYRQAYERWLDESSLAGYRKLYKLYFLTSDHVDSAKR